MNSCVPIINNTVSILPGITRHSSRERAIIEQPGFSKWPLEAKHAQRLQNGFGKNI
jgi:hypothetical protein